MSKDTPQTPPGSQVPGGGWRVTPGSTPVNPPSQGGQQGGGK